MPSINMPIVRLINTMMSNKKQRYVMPSLMFLLAGIAGFSLFHFTQKIQQASSTPALATIPQVETVSENSLIGSRRPDTVLPDLEGNERNISEWDGKVMLVNFWATWCPPCRREMPDFIALREQYHSQGFEILGVAIDTPDRVKHFVESMGVTYPVVHGEMDAVTISASYGNTTGALPYSALIDREGNIRFLHMGELSKSKLETELTSLL